MYTVLECTLLHLDICCVACWFLLLIYMFERRYYLRLERETTKPGLNDTVCKWSNMNRIPIARESSIKIEQEWYMNLNFRIFDFFLCVCCCPSLGLYTSLCINSVLIQCRQCIEHILCVEDIWTRTA